jgi:hypothetical protein
MLIACALARGLYQRRLACYTDIYEIRLLLLLR